MDLNKLKDKLYKELIENHVDSDPEYDAFEVEDMKSHQNYVLRFNKGANTVDLFDTSITQDAPKLLNHFSEPFPFNLPDAYSHYRYLFNKSMQAVDDICFLGYVDEHFEPIEIEEDNSDSE